MNDKIFKCECGKEFFAANRFNGHKSGCKEHHIAKYGSLAYYNLRYKNSTAKSTATIRKKAKISAEEKLQRWISEHHTCEKCGKVMTEKYGSGRFCSQSCANGRSKSVEERRRIGSGVIKTRKENPISAEKIREIASHVHESSVKNYESNPKYCSVCGKQLSYERRFNKTCSDECYETTRGGLRHGSDTGKHGWYKGHYCDSSYELAYVIYHLDHSLPFERNKKSYEYIGEDGKLHEYYPDFIEDNKLVEIKGYVTDEVYLKIAAVTDMPVRLLTLDDIQYMIEYVKETYNCSDITSLYESEKHFES